MATLVCPACTAPALFESGKGQLSCPYCRSTYRGKPLICPACDRINEELSDVCLNCGEPMTVVAQVLRRGGSGGSPRWLELSHTQANKLKAEGERTSAERMREFQEIDRRRIETDSRELRKRMERDRRMLVGVLIVILIVLSSLVAIYVMSS